MGSPESSAAGLPEAVLGKGVNFCGLLDSFDRLYPELGRQALFAALPDLPEISRPGGLLVSGWYPVAWYVRLHVAVREVTGEGTEISRRLGFESTHADFGANGVYRFMAKRLGPRNVFILGQRIFQFYWRPARLNATTLSNEGGKVTAQGHWTDCHGFSADVWRDVFGSTEAILQLAGAESVELRVASGAGDGDAEAVIEASWC